MKHLLLIATFLFNVVSYGQNHWQEIKINDINLRNHQETRVLPTEFKAYKLDIEGISQRLVNAPSEELAINIESDMIITLPLGNGALHKFRVYESPVMQESLAKKFKTIKTYKGVSITDATKTVRLDVTPKGFHAAIQTLDNIFYIDPYASDDVEHYISYDVAKDVASSPDEIPTCGVDHVKNMAQITQKNSKSRTSVIPLRKYRIAIACTGEYGKWKGSKEKAMADIVTGLNRMNQVFENEASIRYILVDGNEKLLNFDKNTDPYPSTKSGGDMLSINTNIISTKIGVNAYDLGHVYSTSCDVGGVALLGSLCSTRIKGAGVTCHYGSDINYFAVRVTAHEIGHQMSANHTFNNCGGENENLGTGFEPGSGSTIMSYAGLCGSNNVQSAPWANYHNHSLFEIYNHTRNNIADDCAVKEDFNNHEPIVTLPELYKKKLYIPTETYFYLEGSATDEDGDSLTYSWEGMNTGALSPLGTPFGDAPRFQTFAPSTDGVRYFPKSSTILNNESTSTEILPTESQKFNFNLAARDNHFTGGTATWASMSFNSHKTPEKFGFTSQTESGISNVMGDEVEITWNVAGTDKAPVNCPLVDIYYTTAKINDFSFDNAILLEEGVPNDGVHTVTIPFVKTNRGHFILKSRNNIFFDVNDKGMQITEPATPAIYASATPLYQKLCIPDETSLTVTADVYGDTLSHDIELAIEGLPEGTIATFDKKQIKSGESTNLSLDFSDVLVTTIIQPKIVFTSATADTFYRTLTLNLVASDFSDLATISPIVSEKNVTGSPTFTWSKARFAEGYDFEVSDSPAFTNILESVTNTEDTTFASNIIYDKSTIFYWRVKPHNNCGSGAYSDVQVFSTAAFACEELTANNLPLSISQSGTPVIDAEFNMLSQGEIADVNIKLMEGDHTLNKDLVGKLISPQGTEVLLFKNICSQRNFKCGFDDESNTPVKCPLSRENVYRPKEKFSTFNGENPIGVWKLSLADTKPGNGGKFNNAIIEICGNVTTEDPTQVTLSKLNASTNAQGNIGPWHMHYSDDKASKSELVYTIVEAPELGTIYLNDQPLSIGATFTQDDIHSLSLSYKTTDKEGDDKAKFIVSDGEGGWDGVFTLDIAVNSANPVSTSDDALNASITLSPNPTNRYIQVNTENILLENVKITDIQGKVMLTLNRISNNQQIDLSKLSNGIYILNASADGKTVSKRIVLKK